MAPSDLPVPDPAASSGSDFDVAEVDRLLTTTKQVRKRLDLTRRVPREVLLECIDVASHAPQGGNIQANNWMIVDDPELIAKIGVYYEQVGRPYLDSAAELVNRRPGSTQSRVVASGQYLVDNIAKVPAIVVALRQGALAEGLVSSATFMGSVLPGVWSFQLAARARGIGSTWTTFTLAHHGEVAKLLGIPDGNTQVAVLPCGYYLGTSFQPAKRFAARDITFVNRWGEKVGQ